MRLVSWNLFGLEERNLDARTEAALFRILLGGSLERLLATGAPPPPPPEVLLLQEVVERTWFAHLRPHLEAAGYTLFPKELPARNYFEVIAVRGLRVRSSRVSRFERTGQGRHLNRVDLDTPFGSLAVFTAHLESLKSGTELRIEQAERVFLALDSCERAIFGGDTNLRAGEVKHRPAAVVDAFEALGSPRGHRATWGSARYDRFWVKGLQVQGFETFGAEVLDGLGEAASDHKGLSLTVAGAP